MAIFAVAVRPIAKLVHRFFRLSSSLLNALIAISGGETVLTGEPEDWPLHQTLVVPVSSYVPSKYPRARCSRLFL